MSKLLLTLCLIVGSIHGHPKLTQQGATCDFITGIPDIINGYAEGIIITTGNLSAQGSDCYQYTSILTSKLNTLYSSIVNIQLSTAITPIAITNQISVDLSNALEACSTTTLINQIQFRTSTFSGLFNFIFTSLYEGVFGTLM